MNIFKCSDCGKLNIYADIKEIAIEKGKEEIQAEVQKLLEKSFKNRTIKL